MPLMRHSTRPMPPPWSARRASTVTRSTGEVSCGLVRDDGDAGHAAAVEQLGEIELGGGLSHLAVGVAGELLAHQVGAVEGLVELVDAEHLEAADDAEHLRALGRGVEEALRGDGQPLAACCSDAASPAASPVAALQIRTVVSGLPETSRVPSGENATDVTQPECPSKRADQLPAGRVPQLDASCPSCPRARARRRARTPPSQPGASAPRRCGSAARWPHPTA